MNPHVCEGKLRAKIMSPFSSGVGGGRRAKAMDGDGAQWWRIEVIGLKVSQVSLTGKYLSEDRVARCLRPANNLSILLQQFPVRKLRMIRNVLSMSVGVFVSRLCRCTLFLFFKKPVYKKLYRARLNTLANFLYSLSCPSPYFFRVFGYFLFIPLPNPRF